MWVIERWGNSNAISMSDKRNSFSLLYLSEQCIVAHGYCTKNGEQWNVAYGILAIIREQWDVAHGFTTNNREQWKRAHG